MRKSPDIDKLVGQFFLVAVSVFVTGRLGLMIPYLNSHISLFWLPTGIGVAALIWFGPQTAAAILCGSFLINYTSGASIIVSIGIAIGSTLAVLLSYFILQWTGFQKNMLRAFDVALFISAAAIGMQVSAIVGVTSLYFGGALSSPSFVGAWKTWWMGDAVGVLLATPLLLSFSKASFREILGRWQESIGLIAASFVIASRFLILSNDVLFVSSAFLVIAWAGIRFGQLGASAIVLIISGATTVGASIANPNQLPAEDGLLVLWSFLCAMSIFSLFLTSLQATKVGVTRELKNSLDHLKADISLRKQAELALVQSEHRFRDLVDSTDGIVWEADATNFVFNFVSRNAERILGYPVADWLQPNFWAEHIHPEDQAQAIKYCVDCTGRLENHNFTYRFITQEGKTLWLEDRVVVVEENGKPRWLRGLMVDITEKQKNEAKLIHLIEENVAILRSAKFSIITTDPKGTITGFNEEAERVLGYKAEEMISKQSPSLFHDPNEIVAVAKILSEESGEKVPVGFETFIFKANKGTFDERQWTYLRKDGNRVQVKLNVTPLRDKKGDIYGYMGIAREITAELQAKKALDFEKAKSHHNAKLASLGEMSAGIAHEINNPLAIIVGSVNLLGRLSNNPEKFTAKVEMINKACHRITKIVSSLKKFSRTDEKSAYEPHSLSQIVSEALTLTEARAKQYSVPVTFECSTEAWINCHDVEIEQVLVNLINNALDAVKDNQEKWVRISVHENEAGVILKVMDSGMGISENVMNKLFEPFFTTKKVGEGTGLGLSIAKGILDEHQATITVLANVPNTCFKIRFPKAAERKNAA